MLPYLTAYICMYYHEDTRASDVFITGAKPRIQNICAATGVMLRIVVVRFPNQYVAIPYYIQFCPV